MFSLRYLRITERTECHNQLLHILHCHAVEKRVEVKKGCGGGGVVSGQKSVQLLYYPTVDIEIARPLPTPSVGDHCNDVRHDRIATLAKTLTVT